MKIKGILLLCFILGLAVFFTSCGTSVDIAKRHFNKGYYIHVSSKKHLTPVEIINTQSDLNSFTVAEEKQKSVITTSVEADAQAIPGNVDDVFIASTSEKALVAKTKQLKDITVSSKIPLSFKNNTHFDAYKTHHKKFGKTENYSFGGNNVPGIVLVILCIFIPPLAVFLSDGIGNPFWLDLIFWILGWGVGFSLNPIGFVFWLLAIVYAFTICF